MSAGCDCEQVVIIRAWRFLHQGATTEPVKHMTACQPQHTVTYCSKLCKYTVSTKFIVQNLFNLALDSLARSSSCIQLVVEHLQSDVLSRLYNKQEGPPQAARVTQTSWGRT